MYLVHDYDRALQDILENGVVKVNKRTGTRTMWIPGIRSEYDLRTDRIPAISRRKLNYYAVVGELLWFLKGYSDNTTLQIYGCNYWTPWVNQDWAKANGFIPESFGPVYGFQLRYYNGYFSTGAPNDPQYGLGGIDQLARMMHIIKEDPSSRQNLWSLWNPSSVHLQRLPPCHMVYRVSINIDTQELTGIMYQRSCDFPVGVPANILFYSLLTIMIAKQTGYKPRSLVHLTDDSHIYENQVDAVAEYLASPYIDSPEYQIERRDDIYSYILHDFYIERIDNAPNIKFPIAV